MGSVKDLEIIRKPTRNAMGIGRFHFSDRYSVFDWGEMPDHIDGKGEALCLMGAYCFEKLKENGVRTHYRGLVDETKKVVNFKEVETPTNVMEVDLVNVYRPETHKNQGILAYDYGYFTSSLRNYLIPLEIIYRNGLPEGSSVFRRLSRGVTTPKELGLDHYPKPGERLSQPIFDVSTKLEETDRYVNWDEAKRIAGLENNELTEIKIVLSEANHVISEIASSLGLENEDGKIELAFDQERRLMVVDVLGTLDECRFTYSGLPVSKEIGRRFYRKTQWYKDVETAKKTAELRGVKDWRKICKSQPPKLDKQLRTIISEVYMAAANGLTTNAMFDSPPLAEVISKYEKYASGKDVS
ncbi:phosphoribosylaminoimidazolesuccinocarboxamide synthase [Candidatus Bathyarchaeota archaeon]|nr:phosphoribosylaminoimidazolesuccinocarboxamide synthase [Candidatus Bathyarchaeota archaeon]